MLPCLSARIIHGHLFHYRCCGIHWLPRCARLLQRGDQIIGYDNVNSYYSVELKRSRLALLAPFERFTFIEADLNDRQRLFDTFQRYSFDRVIHLAAQAGVRYSLTNPYTYIDSNIAGFINILEACRHTHTPHLTYASSSSVYGSNTSMPFSVHHNVDHHR